MKPLIVSDPSTRPIEAAPAGRHGSFAMASIFAGLTMAVLGAGSSAQPPKKEDPDRIPATSIPEVAPAKDAKVVDKAELEKQLGIKIMGELSVVRSKNLTLHYPTPANNAAEVEKQKLAFVMAMEAHLVHHAKVLFGEDKVTLSSTIDVYLHSDSLNVPKVGLRSGIYIGEASSLEPKKFRTQIAGFRHVDNKDDPDAAVRELTRLVRHEWIHALLRNRYPGKLVAICWDEGLAVNVENDGIATSRERYLDVRDEKFFEKYATATRVMRGLSDANKNDKEIRGAYVSRALLVNTLINREDVTEKGWRKFGGFLDLLDKRGLIDKELTEVTREKFEDAFKDGYGLKLDELDSAHETNLGKIVRKKQEK